MDVVVNDTLQTRYDDLGSANAKAPPVLFLQARSRYPIPDLTGYGEPD